jgi:hypothetical protein
MASTTAAPGRPAFKSRQTQLSAEWRGGGHIFNSGHSFLLGRNSYSLILLLR